MGVALQDKGDRDAAIDSYKQAIKIDPDNAKAHQNLGLLFLNTGRLKEGLDENEWRWRNTDNLLDERHFSLPLWDGISSLEDKTILVWGEQGPGDMIIWSSCVEKLSSISGHCILECSEKLFSLFARSFPDVEVKIANSSLDAERDDFDFHLPMGSLFRHFIDEISTDHITKAYLVPDPDRVNLWRERLNVLGVGPFVGISWKSPLMTSTRRPNYTEISDWAPLFSNTSINFINLQSTDFADDLTAIQDKFGIKVHNFDDLDHYNDLDNVAALSAALDAVVSVATAVPTLTAAVGTPTKLASWRQSPWNNILFTPVGPHFDVFERNTWDSWSNVFHSIADDILSYKIIRREI
jgi:tetratricopeptide (TPR) repeat protein